MKPTMMVPMIPMMPMAQSSLVVERLTRACCRAEHALLQPRKHASTSLAGVGSVRFALGGTTKGSTIHGREATHERKLEEAAHGGSLVPRFDGGPCRLPRYEPGLFCRLDRALYIGGLRQLSSRRSLAVAARGQ